MISVTMSCKKIIINPDKPDPKPTVTTSFEFLKLGNQWKYVEYEHYMRDTTDLHKDSCWVSHCDTSIVSILSINTNGYITIEEKEFSDKYQPDIEYWFSNTEKWAIDSKPTRNIEGMPILLKNCAVGQNWFWSDNDGDKYSISVVSARENVRVPAGIFENCIKICITEISDKKPDIEFLWISPQYGLIKKIAGDEVKMLYSKNF